MRAGAIIVAVAAALSIAAAHQQRAAPRPVQAPFSIVEASIGEMRDAMAQGRTTSRQIVQQSLDRIARFEGRLNAVITLNTRALAEADALDRERRAGRL
ncbi:MAG TPA: amidase, partial [Candidatus Limnocylindria bacterium]|nr:amidase [Candidatus Limnocylindria bacterium]